MQDNGEIIIVGVCAAGKSTLAARLRGAGMRARTVAQEHSCIPELWRWSGATTMVYLHASYHAVKQRRVSLMSPANYDAQIHRLRSARQAATIAVDTSNLPAEEVYELVSTRLAACDESKQDEPDPHPSIPPVPDEPGSDLQPTVSEPVPVPDEPGERPQGSQYEGLPIPEEL